MSNLQVLTPTMKKLIIIIASIILSMSVFAQILPKQSKYTISGFVRDSASGEMLIGTAVIIKELESTGASTNAYGFYSITISEGNYSIATQLIGYKSKLYKIELKQNTKLDIKLSENASQLSEVTVTSEKKDENITKTQMGVEQLDVKQINSIQVLFGETD